MNLKTKWIDLAAEAAFFDGICRGKKVHEPLLYCMYEHKEIKKGYKKLTLMGVS